MSAPPATRAIIVVRLGAVCATRNGKPPSCTQSQYAFVHGYSLFASPDDEGFIGEIGDRDFFHPRNRIIVSDRYNHSPNPALSTHRAASARIARHVEEFEDQ
jgi:hypothetical protein